MPDIDHDENVQRLRRYVADMETENALLRGDSLPSASVVELRAGNAELRRQIASAGGPGGDTARGQQLTIQQAAAELNVSTWQVLRELRESLPLSVDPEGRTVVSRADLSAYLLAKAQGRSTKRFL